jgi:hypothetical protein
LEEGVERLEPIQILLCALNPIKGWRDDDNCTAYRNFLVELDFGLLAAQRAYIERLGMPFSACVFSGNKSLHYLISLDTDLPSENVYRHFSEWILKIVNLADQNTKNPSRSIRVPGAWREPTKQQKMVEFRGPVSTKELYKWLNEHPEAKPRERETKQISEEEDISKVKGWVLLALEEGIDPSKGRNKQWFSIACEFALSGYSEDDTIRKLSYFFQPDRDFKEKEWKTAIRSAFKYVYNRK